MIFRAATKAFLVGVAANILGGCGGATLSASETRYAEVCSATNRAFGGGDKRALCECSARIMVPRLSEGEYNALVNMSADLQGRILTVQNTAPHGFTPTDFGNLMRKTQEAMPEITRSCGS